MNKRVLLDTNIILDLALNRNEFWEPVVEICEAIADFEIEGYICATSLKDIYYILTKHMGEKDARVFTKSLMQDFTICTVDAGLCYQAITGDEPDFEDGIVRLCAETARVDYIISRDDSAFENSPIKRMSAQEFADRFL